MGCSCLTWVVLSLPGGAEAPCALWGGRASLCPPPTLHPVFWVVGGGSRESLPPSSGAGWRGVCLSQGWEDCEPEDSRKAPEKHPDPSGLQMEVCYQEGLPKVDILHAIKRCTKWPTCRQIPKEHRSSLIRFTPHLPNHQLQTGPPTGAPRSLLTTQVSKPGPEIIVW